MIAAAGSAAVVLILAFRARPRPPARLPTCRSSTKNTTGITDATGAATTAASWQSIIRHVSARARPNAAVEAIDVAAWCEGLARVARSGSTLAASLRQVEPPLSCRSTVDAVTLALERGRGLTEVLDVRHPSPHLSLAFGVLRACAINGGPPSEPLDRTAATLRRRAVAAAERRTQSAQARLSAVVMTLLPIAMLAILLLTSSATRTATTTPVGLVTVIIGVALNGLGWRWMRRIIGSGGP